MRGRLMGVQRAVVAGGPRLGDLEAGAVATAFGDTVSVVSGGLACIAGALLLAWRVPEVTGLRSALPEPAAPAQPPRRAPPPLSPPPRRPRRPRPHPRRPRPAHRPSRGTRVARRQPR